MHVLSIHSIAFLHWKEKRNCYMYNKQQTRDSRQKIGMFVSLVNHKYDSAGTLKILYVGYYGVVGCDVGRTTLN